MEVILADFFRPIQIFSRGDPEERSNLPRRTECGREGSEPLL